MNHQNINDRAGEVETSERVRQMFESGFHTFPALVLVCRSGCVLAFYPSRATAVSSQEVVLCQRRMSVGRILGVPLLGHGREGISCGSGLEIPSAERSTNLTRRVSEVRGTRDNKSRACKELTCWSQVLSLKLLCTVVSDAWRREGYDSGMSSAAHTWNPEMEVFIFCRHSNTVALSVDSKGSTSSWLEVTNVVHSTSSSDNGAARGSSFVSEPNVEVHFW